MCQENDKPNSGEEERLTGMDPAVQAALVERERLAIRQQIINLRTRIENAVEAMHTAWRFHQTEAVLDVDWEEMW